MTPCDVGSATPCVSRSDASMALSAKEGTRGYSEKVSFSRTPLPGLRERTRNVVRSEITAAAMELFLDQGFDQTTIDQLVAATGISRRSFFRYFATKEDVVLGFMGDLGDSLVAELAARPAEEPVWNSLRRACDPALARYASDPERVLALYQLFEQAPSLRAREAEKRLRWQAGLSLELGRRLGVDPTEDLRPAVLAGAAMAALKAALDIWALHPERATPATSLDAAFAALASA